jgi:hypothetical protein
MLDELIDYVKNEVEFDYIVVIMDIRLFDKLSLKKMLKESQWIKSKKKGWVVRVDPENPQLKQQRHVYVTRDEHISAKNMQVAWNSNGSRHDKSSFNDNINGMNTAKEIARDALGLSDDVVLEWADISERNKFLNESTSDIFENTPIDPVLLIAASLRKDKNSVG